MNNMILKTGIIFCVVGCVDVVQASALPNGDRSYLLEYSEFCGNGLVSGPILSPRASKQLGARVVMGPIISPRISLLDLGTSLAAGGIVSPKTSRSSTPSDDGLVAHSMGRL